MIAQTLQKVKLYALKCRNFYISTVYAKQPGGTRLHFAVASLIPVKLYLLHVPLPETGVIPTFVFVWFRNSGAFFPAS